MFASTYDLPPTAIAKALPVRNDNNPKKNGKNGASKKKNDTKRKASSSRPAAVADDTPRAFARLMLYQQLGKKPPSGLDDGNDRPKSKKRKRDDGRENAVNNDTATTAAVIRPKEKSANAATIPKILPGEKLSDFAARVDQAMPLSGMKKSQRSAPQSSDISKIREDRVTKHEKHLRRLQKGWREEESRIKEKEAEERELREAEQEQQLELWKEWKLEAGKGKPKKTMKSKKKKRRRGDNNDPDADDDDDNDDDDDDPWAKLNTGDRASKQANPLEVVQAPPQSLTKPREIFKVRRGVGGVAGVDVANVPTAAGSLRRREELAEQRKSIVEEYRRLMAEKRQQ